MESIEYHMTHIMNFPYLCVWMIRDPPSAESITSIEKISDHILIGDPAIFFEESVEPFYLTFPVIPTEHVQRLFQGGTVLSMFQFIYDFYQEPVTFAEIDYLKNLSAHRHHNRFETHRNTLLSGGIVRRLEVIGSSATYEGIEAGELLIDP